ncbi:LysR family transcriptional regulator [Spirillospora sp. NPDC052269]
MDLQQMRYVVAVAEEGGFTRAAERCRVVQSALSHQIARLERELGARLFERTSRRVKVTPAGEAFLPAARQALDAAERARAEVAAASGEIRGRLAIGAISTVAAVDLPSLLKGYRERYPQVRITLRAGISEELIDQVKDGSLDIGFLGMLPGSIPKGVSDLELERGNLVAVVGPEHRFADQSETDLASLANETFVDFAAGTIGRSQSDQAFAAADVQRDVAFEVTSPEFIAEIIRQGLAVGMLPANYAQRLQGVRTLCVRDAPGRVERLIWSRHRPSPPAAAFLKFLDVEL